MVSGNAVCHTHALGCDGHDGFTPTSIAFGSDVSVLRLLLRRDDTMFTRPGHCSSGRKLNGHVEVNYYINPIK